MTTQTAERPLSGPWRRVSPDSLKKFGFDPARDDVESRLTDRPFSFVRAFQLCVGVARRPNTRKRTCLHRYESLQTLRFTLIDQPVRIVRPAGRTQLRFAVSRGIQRRIEHAERRIARAA